VRDTGMRGLAMIVGRKRRISPFPTHDPKKRLDNTGQKELFEEYF